MYSSYCCLLSYIQVSQEAGNVVWYFHLVKNIPQFVVIHTVKGFSIVSEADLFNSLAFSVIQQDQTLVPALGAWSLCQGCPYTLILNKF